MNDPLEVEFEVLEDHRVRLVFDEWVLPHLLRAVASSDLDLRVVFRHGVARRGELDHVAVRRRRVAEDLLASYDEEMDRRGGSRGPNVKDLRREVYAQLLKLSVRRDGTFSLGRIVDEVQRHLRQTGLKSKVSGQLSELERTGFVEKAGTNQYRARRVEPIVRDRVHLLDDE